MKGEEKAMTNEMPRVEIPADREKIERLIIALQQQLERDTSVKDKAIHKQAIEDLKKSFGEGIKMKTMTEKQYNEMLKNLHNIEAKKIVLNELLRKYDFLKVLEQLSKEDSYVVADGAGLRSVKIENEEIVKKINNILILLQDEVRKDIEELEKYYYEVLKGK